MQTEILIVEDEGLIALDMQKRLEQAGYAVRPVVDNADDALRSVGECRPALVMMDIRLHGSVDGIEAADQIRRRFHVPVMFVTAQVDHETLDRARIAEPFGYVTKPFHGVNFRAQIEMALWKHKMEQKLRISEAWLATTFQNVADALIEFAQHESISHVVFGQSARSRLDILLRGSVINRFLAEIRDATVQVVPISKARR